MAISGSKLSSIAIAQILALRATGFSIRQIADELDLSRCTVHKYVKALGGEQSAGDPKRPKNSSSGSETLVEK
jgi:predicted transcriptional regulator